MRFFLWALGYKIVLELVYRMVVSPTYAYTGLIWKPNAWYCFISYACFCFLFVLMPKYKDRPSSHLSQLLYFTTGVPILSYFWQTSQSVSYLVYVVICFTILFLILRPRKTDVRPIKVTFMTETKTDKFTHFIFFISFILILYFTAVYGGIDTRAFNFSRVYDIRTEIVYTGAWGYIINWLTKLFIPFCVVMYMVKKNIAMLLLSVLMQIYLYLSTGSKTLLFSVVLLIVCTHMLKKGNFEIGIPKLYALITAGSTLFFYITNQIMAIALFPTRQLIIPAQISFIHFDFFSERTKLHLSETMIGKVLGIDSPYSVHSTFLVGNNTGNNWNTGFLADAYDNMGFLAMISYTIILSLILLLVDGMSKNSAERYKYSSLIVYSMIILNDGSLLTAITTWGLGLLLVFIYIVASKEYSRAKKQISTQ